MSDDYTPDTQEVRDAYAWYEGGIYHEYDPKGYPKIDRWLAAHDAEVAAKALREAAAEMQDILLVQRSLLGSPTYTWLRNRADRIEKGST